MNAVESTQACLAHIEARESEIRAWAHLDAEAALAEAAARDESRARGEPAGPLHGFCVGVKDIIDTADMPTEYGSPLYKGRMAGADAEAVRRLRAAGAVIMGKTVTAELAVLHPNETRNPHDLSRTPGGSSSGSAAAVAAGMAAGALGTQTNGSVIRPAAFCGVIGYKPSFGPGFGLIPRTGVLTNSRVLDTVGVFARTLNNAALLAEVMMGAHEGDPDTQGVTAPALSAAAAETPQAPPRLAFAETPVWERTEPGTREAFAGLCAKLSDHITAAPLPAAAAQALKCHATIMDADIARSMRKDFETRPDGLSAVLRAMIERGRKITDDDYARALAFKQTLTQALAGDVFTKVDAVITPAAAGEAPPDHTKGTGDPAFCTLWQLCGLPAVSLPLLTGPNGLPLGVQLVGPPGGDAKLLRTANWIIRKLERFPLN